MIFSSDNWAGAAPRIADALHKAAGGFASAYGTSESDRHLEERFNALFEREVAVFFVGTGTAANALSMALVNRPGGVVFCHEEAHMIEDECGAVEHLTGGARLYPVEGASGKMDRQALSRAIARYSPDFVHSGQPMAVSITQATESGTLHSLDEITAIAAIAHDNDIPLHMDGARFANALVALGCSPADMTWKAGVDLLSFGATKNGCWCAEAIVVFDPERARHMAHLRKRAAQLFSKTRFIAAQLHAYLDDDHWLDLARHANTMGGALAKALSGSNRIRLLHPPKANEVFAIMPKALAEALQAEGAKFYEWNPPKHGDFTIGDDEAVYRFVTSFATQPADIASFTTALERLTQP